MFIIATNKNIPTTTTYKKYIGTASFTENAYSMTVQTDGTAYAMGVISSNAFTNGAEDILLASLKIDGSTYYTQYMGSTISEFPGDLVWNSATR